MTYSKDTNRTKPLVTVDSFAAVVLVITGRSLPKRCVLYRQSDVKLTLKIDIFDNVLII